MSSTVSIDVVKLANENTEFKLHDHGDLIVVRIFEPLKDASLAVLEDAYNLLQKGKPRPVIFDCKNVNELSVLWARFVVGTSRSLGKLNIKVVGLNSNERLRRYLQTQGLNSSLPSAESMDDAMVKLGLPRRQALDVKLLNPFLTAASEAIQGALQTPSQAGRIVVLVPNSPLTGDISGLIRLDCKTLHAVVVLSFPRDTIFAIVEKLTGSRPVDMNSMVKGSVGEITNMTFTKGKKTLNEMGYGIDSAMPKLVEAGNLPEEFMHYTGQSITVPFDTQLGKYYVEVRLAA